MAQLAALPVAAAGAVAAEGAVAGGAAATGGIFARVAGMFAGRAAGAAGRAAAPVRVSGSITHHQAIGGLMAFNAMQPRPNLGSSGQQRQMDQVNSVLNADQFS